MLCHLCKNHACRPKKCVYGKTSWIDVPCVNFTKAGVDRHNSSEAHQLAVQRETQLALSAQQGSIKDQMDSIERRSMIGRFKCLYWLFKEQVPHTTHFESLLELIRSLGADYIDGMYKGENAKYCSEQFIDEALTAMAHVIHQKIIQQISESPQFALLIDETTDIAIDKDLIIYCKYLCDRQPHTSFIGLVQLPDGKAPTIYNALVNRRAQEGLDLQVRPVLLALVFFFSVELKRWRR